MKKVLSVIAVSAFVMTAGVAVAGGPGKKKDAACPEACQQQIDDLQSSQAQQNEQLGAHGKQLENHEGRITALEKDAYDPWYVRVGLSASWASMDLLGVTDILGSVGADSDAGFGGSVAVGREFGQFRVEAEIAYQGADLDDVDGSVLGEDFAGDNLEYSATTFMVNGYYEIPVYDAFSVYGMLGMGLARLEGEGTVYTDVLEDAYKVDSTDYAFAYKAGLGLTYNFTDEIAGDLGYEYLRIADTDIADSFGSHNIVGSVRFKF